MKSVVQKIVKITLPALLVMASSSPALAKARKKIDVDKLQKKYWKAKDYKTGVVQGRKYSKSGKFRVGLEYMNLLNDKYSDSDGLANARVDLSYYINERLSFGGFYENLDLANNSAMEAVAEFNNGGFIDHVKAANFVGASLEFVPIYSKMSWMNDKIIYFDLSISPKVGLASYEQQLSDGSNPEESTIFLGLDIAANIFLSRTTSVSLAYRTRFFQSEVLAYNGAGTEVVNDAENNFYNFLSLGLNFYL